MMTTDTAALLALVLYLIGTGVAFGLRTWTQRRRTGSSGFNGFSSLPGSAGWWGGVLFLTALVLTAIGPVLALLDVLRPPAWVPAAMAWAGLVVVVAGFIGVVASQSRMGASWRVGVDPGERTELVTGGVFAVVRNPIFTAMCTVVFGLLLMVFTPVTLAAFAALVVAVQLQVRAVEEPYLRTTHGQHYTDYAARVGRFVPGFGYLQRRPGPRSS